MICKSCGASWRPGNRKSHEYCPVCGCYLELTTESVGFSDIRELVCYLEHCNKRDFYWTPEIFSALIDSFLEMSEQKRSEIRSLLYGGIKTDIERWRTASPSKEAIHSTLQSYQVPFSIDSYVEDIYYIWGEAEDPGESTDSAEFYISYAQNCKVPAYELQALLHASRLGSEEAALQAAKGLEKGKYGTPDYDIEMQILKMVEDGGNPEVLYQLGRMLRLGWGTAEDTENALKYFRLSAEKGHSKAEYQMAAILSEQGRDEEGMHYLISAAKNRYMPALFDLAERLLHGDGIEKNEEEGIRLLKDCARNGNMEADEMLHILLDKR